MTSSICTTKRCLTQAHQNFDKMKRSKWTGFFFGSIQPNNWEKKNRFIWWMFIIRRQNCRCETIVTPYTNMLSKYHRFYSVDQWWKHAKNQSVSDAYGYYILWMIAVLMMYFDIFARFVLIKPIIFFRAAFQLILRTERISVWNLSRKFDWYDVVNDPLPIRQ